MQYEVQKVGELGKAIASIEVDDTTSYFVDITLYTVNKAGQKIVEKTIVLPVAATQQRV